MWRPPGAPEDISSDWDLEERTTPEGATAGSLRAPRQSPHARQRRAVKVLRQRLGMTQAEFAGAFHLPITTLRDWEQHRSTPDAPARALLLAIERDPDVMRRLLADRAAWPRRLRRVAGRRPS